VSLEDDKARIREKLGLDKIPDPRMPVPHALPDPGKGDLVNYRKAVALVDPIETAAFEKYLDPEMVIDQEMDTRAFHPEQTRALTIRTDMPIPTNNRIFKSTGIGAETNSQNYYLWLAQEIKRHWIELGCRAISRPYVFRCSGASGTVPFIGVIFKVDTRPKDGQTNLDQGANWALLTPKTSPTLDAVTKEEIN
jgi:hypothetical protein